MRFLPTYQDVLDPLFGLPDSGESEEFDKYSRGSSKKVGKIRILLRCDPYLGETRNSVQLWWDVASAVYFRVRTKASTLTLPKLGCVWDNSRPPQVDG